jgi:hypothetical protein
MGTTRCLPSAAGGTHVHATGVADAAAVHGYTTAFWWAVGIFALGFILALVILPGRAGWLLKPACDASALAIRPSSSS